MVKLWAHIKYQVKVWRDWVVVDWEDYGNIYP
jgi:hypothetical protein